MCLVVRNIALIPLLTRCLFHIIQAELIEFYYLWKKTQSGSKLMKSMRKQTRRPTNLVRRMRGRPNRTLSADYVDLNPSSDDDRESEDSDKDLASYQCTNCSATGMYISSRFILSQCTRQPAYHKHKICTRYLLIRPYSNRLQNQKTGIQQPKIKLPSSVVIADYSIRSMENCVQLKIEKILRHLTVNPILKKKPMKMLIRLTPAQRHQLLLRLLLP